MKKGDLFLICLAIGIFLISFASAANFFTEDFGIGTSWTTTVPGWAKSSTLTSGRDDQLSRTAGSDGNYYVWLSRGVGDEYIQKDSISTSGYQNIKISYYYNLYGDFSEYDSLFLEWRLSPSGSWNIIQKTTGLPGWNYADFNLPGAEDSIIDLRIRENGLNENNYIIIDDITLRGDVIAECGNGVIEGTEECDEPPYGTGRCSPYCTLTFCGDATKQTPNGLGTGGPLDDGNEDCDDGNLMNDDECDNNCIAAELPEPECGDEIINGDDECELPSTSDNINCIQNPLTDCNGNKQGTRDPYGDCNSGCDCVVDSFSNYHCVQGACGAVCDSDNDCPDQAEYVKSCNLDSCSCEYIPTAACGNGVQEAGEECDDGNQNNEDDCRNDCTLPYCGDGIVDSGEECDDGNFNNYDNCPDFCELAVCGDGYIYESVEECDDGNTFPGDGCNSTCFLDIDELCTLPIDAMLVIDKSGSMSGFERLVKAKLAAKIFIGLMNDSEDKVGLVSFSELSTLDEGLTFDHDDVKTAIDSLVAGGRTNLGSGIYTARIGIDLNGRTDAPHVMIILSDGAPNLWGEDNPPASCPEITPNASNDCTDYALQQATLAKNNGVIVYTIGLGITPGSFTEQLLKDIASSPDKYFSAPSADDLEAIYLQIAETLCPCGDGVVGPGEQCDDHNNNNYDECTNDCKLNVCSDGYVYVDSEDCELPNTINNMDCIQTIFECLGTKAGSRDLFGDCGASCFCEYDPFNYACVVGECGAECATDPDCEDQNPYTEDNCNLETCGCEYSFCGDGIVDSGEDCDDGNQNNGDLCSNDCTLTYCGDVIVQAPNGIGTGGPLNDGFEDCDDGNPDNTNYCLDNCAFAECGDSYIWSGQEDCELPGTPNNINCGQSTTQCQSYKKGTRDSYGDCDTYCGCLTDPFVYECVAGECGADCAVNADCSQSQQECQGGSSNKTGVRDAYGDCESDCLCIYDPFEYECIEDSCGASCDSNNDCDDQNDNTIDICNIESCSCEYTYVDIIKKDSKVAQAMPTSNFGTGRYMIVNPKIAGTDRSYVRIDLSSFIGGANFTKADLEIAVYYTGSNVIGRGIEAYYCPEHDFVETAINWNNQPLDDDCMLADTYNITNKVIAGLPHTWHMFDLLDEANEEISNDDGLFTVVLKSSEEGAVSDNSKYVQYLTKEYSESAFRPKLEIS